MRVDFICKACNHVEEIKYDIQTGPPKDVVCPECDKPMKRSFKKDNAGTAIVPDYFGDDVFNNISLRMKNNLPSGKTKNLY